MKCSHIKVCEIILSGISPAANAASAINWEAALGIAGAIAANYARFIARNNTARFAAANDAGALAAELCAARSAAADDTRITARSARSGNGGFNGNSFIGTGSAIGSKKVLGHENGQNNQHRNKQTLFHYSLL